MVPSVLSPDAGTEELDSSYLETVTVHGREFQRYSIDHRIYFAPVDDDEAERLELQHQIFNRVFDDRLIFPPIPKPRRILDCGYGAGAWAVDVAERYPNCEVIGVDISPHMKPDETPENLWLQVDDLNAPFTFPPNHFDLVHSRLVASGINRSRWQSYIRDIVNVVKRGGWVQMVEIYFNVQSDNGSLTDEHALRQWSIKYRSALEDLKDLRVGTRLGSLLAAAGLVEVDTRMIPLPLSAWSTDPRMREIGALNRENVHRLLSATAIYPFTQRLGMSRDEFEVLVARARQEADNPSLKAYFPLYVSIGRKP
ncbi:S-adenosyl-L-methionine-dependent methyltransferase [Thermoascus aurantiacus ATCC 26904]